MNKQQRGFRQMLIPMIIMAVLAIVLTVITYLKGGGGIYSGFKISREPAAADYPTTDFCLHCSGYDSISCSH